MKKFNKYFNTYDYGFYVGKCIYRSKFGTPYVNGVGTNFLKNLPRTDAICVARALNRLADFEEGKIQINNDLSRWIPCHERMPKEDEDVLVYDGINIFVAWYQNSDDYEGWNSCDTRFCKSLGVIQWKPLPEP